VESIFARKEYLTAGTTLTAVFFENGRPLVTFCSVYSEAPLVLKTRDEMAQTLEFPRNCVLVHQQEGRLLKGDAEVLSCHPERDAFLLPIKAIEWEDLDRRSHPRIDVAVPVALRAVHDLHGSVAINIYQGATLDLSLGGALVSVKPQVAVGSLVEFQATLGPDEVIRTFGVVAHSSESNGTIGIEFLDYVGAARVELDAFLEQAARKVS
jgi:hypothetical protein